MITIGKPLLPNTHDKFPCCLDTGTDSKKILKTYTIDQNVSEEINFIKKPESILTFPMLFEIQIKPS